MHVCACAVHVQRVSVLTQFWGAPSIIMWKNQVVANILLHSSNPFIFHLIGPPRTVKIDIVHTHIIYSRPSI